MAKKKEKVIVEEKKTIEEKAVINFSTKSFELTFNGDSVEVKEV